MCLAPPPRSPDLSSCKFFLWGYLKCRVCIHKPHSLTELKDAIRVQLQLIDREMLGENHIQEDGRHLQDLIFHK
ncbi:hypothetical protein B7P43_G08432 [Cryptotermes secundus]|uniref:Uncharacterized protein n=1 Tax=Cryptotermes secundus TaxID=105785 RepID=A0A2J7QL49_9NEOP|nr:hypothetical protein B7P43_G08432 [Cryptotermes secundus]